MLIPFASSKILIIFINIWPNSAKVQPRTIDMCWDICDVWAIWGLGWGHTLFEDHKSWMINSLETTLDAQVLLPDNFPGTFLQKKKKTFLVSIAMRVCNGHMEVASISALYLGAVMVVALTKQRMMFVLSEQSMTLLLP